MKKILFPILAMALIGPCLADTVPALSIQTETTEQNLSLAGISKVRYTETEMHITMHNGDEHIFLIDEIKAMRFTETADSVMPTRIVSNPEQNLPTMIFRLDGTRKGGDKKGIFIIKSDKDTRKVIK